MLHKQTVLESTLDLLKKIQALPNMSGMRLVGGTALALHLGHRKSVDLDLFGRFDEHVSFRYLLMQSGHVADGSENGVVQSLRVDGVKVDFVNYPYPWLQDSVVDDGVVLAAIPDIAAMKLSAAANRGRKKDFIDMNRLLQIFSLKEILDMYMQKYPDGSLFIALKSLAYFEDAESDPMPFMFNETDWGVVKANIREAIAGV